MKSHSNVSCGQRLLAATMAALLCGSPLMAQTSTPVSTTDSQSSTTAAGNANNAQSNVQNLPEAPEQDPRLGSTESAMPDPSRGPQRPVLQQNSTNSAASSTMQNVPANAQVNQTVVQQKPVATEEYQEPSGAATAQRGSTNGGAASRPAGTAIAPAKQHRVRSLVIKVGAVVAGAAALGTVYALSHGTSSTPPGVAAHTTAAQR